MGSYGWSGESVKLLTEWLEKIGVETVGEPVKVQNSPSHEVLRACMNYGRDIAQALKDKIASLS